MYRSTNDNSIEMEVIYTAAVIFLLAVGNVQSQFTYGNKCYLTDDPLDARESVADVVFSGRVLSVHKNPHNVTYFCTISIYRVLKGEGIVANYLDLPSDASLYNKTVEVSGFGSEHICDNDVVADDTRIFLTSYHRLSNLTLNSSLSRVSVRTLRKSLAEKLRLDETISKCKYFFCAFYAECKLGWLTGDPYCECPSCAGEPAKQVCASDGNWYSSVCETKRMSCTKRRRIRAVSSDRCSAKAPPLITVATTVAPSPSTHAVTELTTATSKEDPCDKMNCEYGAMCIRSIEGLTAKCVCPTSCDSFGDSEGSQPVCGSDGVDYDNECMMEMYNCYNFTKVSVAKVGKCDPCRDVRCAEGQICDADELNKAVCQCKGECPADIDYVCGTDGRTHDNECMLRYAACRQPGLSITIAYKGQCNFTQNPCQNVDCENYATCRVDERGLATCRCPDNCPLEMANVCGSNGKDYMNICKLKQDACALGVNITVASMGRCSNDNCSSYDCPHNGECKLVFSAAADVLVPTCVCPVCSASMQPVCGGNGMTYASECHIRQSNCEREQDVRVSHAGACNLCQSTVCEFGYCRNMNGTAVCVCAAEDACIESNRPVCADDGQTYSNMCELTVESCRQQRKITKVSDGRCDGKVCERESACLYQGTCIGLSCLCDWSCGSKEDLVCGSDEKTYLNTCNLEKRSCTIDKLITVASRGSCTEVMSSSGDGEDNSNNSSAGNLVTNTESTTQVNIASCDQDTNCGFDGLCDYTSGAPGICRCDGISDFCDDSDDVAVCGSDGVMYRNYCELREARCIKQMEIGTRTEQLCQEGSTAKANISEPGSLCNDGQSPLLVKGERVNCSSCLSKDGSQCDVCSSASSYCSVEGVCCPKDPALPECTYTKFGCCPDNTTLPSPGPEQRGCPYTCQCHEIGSNGLLCDPTNFQCDCKPGVSGKTCDMCKVGWWGLRLIETEKNEGCVPCQCNTFGSIRSDCEQNSGRCLCKDGVTGLKCDICVEQGRLLTEDGCIKSGDTTPGEQETCDTMHCGNGQCILDENLKPSCTCNYTCTDEIDYVCGSDGQTYPNSCHLRRRACEYPGLMTMMKGACKQITSPPIVTTSAFPPPTSNSWTGWLFGVRRRYLADEGSQESLGKSTFTYTNRRVTCLNSPCANSGTCVDDVELGFRCLCNVHWKGVKCLQVNDFSSPSFSGESFMRYLWPRKVDSFSLHLTIIPTHSHGILLFAGSHNNSGDFMSLVLNNQYLEFRFDVGGGKILLRSESKVMTNKRYIVRIEQMGSAGKLIVDGAMVKGQAPGRSWQLDTTDDFLYIGHAVSGFEQSLKKKFLSHSLGGVSAGFQGCISELHDAAINVNFQLRNTREANIYDGRDIGQCSSDPCLLEPCENGGFCEMIDAFNYNCECLGPFTGSNCGHKSKRARDILEPTHKHSTGNDGNVVESARFTGNSYLQYRVAGQSNSELTIDLVIYATSEDGVLVYGSLDPSTKGGDFLLLSLENQLPVLRYDLGSGVTTLRLKEKVVLKRWTLLSLEQVGKTASLSIDGLPAASVQSNGRSKYLNIGDEITLGGLPNEVIHYKSYLHSPGFRGVIQWVSFNGAGINDLFQSATVKYGVKKYHGLPCHPNPCQRNFTCVPELDSYRCDPS